MAELLEWAIYNVPGFADLWYRAGPQAPAILFGSLGCISLAVFAFLYYHLARRLLGQHKFGGAWLHAAEYRQAMQVLRDDQAKGKVLSYEEKVALRKFEHGGKMKPMFFEKKYGGYGD